MVARKQGTEEQFVKANHLETVYGQAKAVDSGLWDTVQRIREHYREYSKHCEAIVQQTTSENYSIEQEEKDLLRYKRFLQSFAYDDIKECEVESYYGD